MSEDLKTGIEQAIAAVESYAQSKLRSQAADEPNKRRPRGAPMTEEHKEKLRQGRARWMENRQVKGDDPTLTPPVASPPPQIDADPEIAALERMIESVERGETTLSRQAQTGVSTTFDIPEKGRRPGWDYGFWPFRINGQDVDNSELTELARGGWIPTPASHFPTLNPPGWKRPTIERQGCRMYMRPMKLTLEAREEARRHAFEQKQNRLAQQAIGDIGPDMAPRDPRAGGIVADMQPLL